MVAFLLVTILTYKEYHAMNGYFITGTDTNVGKTCVTAALLHALLQQGQKALAIKPVQTGCPEGEAESQALDVQTYAHFTQEFFPDGYPRANCRQFSLAASPHLAAKAAGQTLNAAQVAQDTLQLGAGYQSLLVEGAGGVAVPLAPGQTMLDLMGYLNIPVILVADNKLGMINHTLLSLESVRNHGLTIAGVIVTNTTPPTKEEALLRKENIHAIAQWGSCKILSHIPHLPPEEFEDRIISYGQEILKALEPRIQSSPHEDMRFDQEHIWHPYTSATNPLPTVKVSKARGTEIILEDGKRLIDGMASWWCAIHGYAHPKLDAAARQQLGRMSHVMFGGLTHEPAIALCRNLCSMAPSGLEHVFLADSGSVSVEAAIKMALQYMQMKGKPKRTKLFTIRGGYHGDTCGAMSVCDPEKGMHHLFSGLLPQQIFAPRPSCGFYDEFDPASMAKATQRLEQHSAEIAAIIVEPIVQGAGGMYFYHPEYLRQLRALADKHDILLILDEIATGFGRTGKLFACQWSDVTPDILCVGKALSGGYVTLAATLASSRVAKTISRNGGVFMHGPTFMGNPLACAIANASLEILQTGTWEKQVRALEGWLKEYLAPCQELPDVADVRVLGAIGVIEMRHDVNVPQLQEFFVQNGVWLRPFGKLIYAMPPYIISREEIIKIATTIHNAIENNVHR